MIRETIEKKTEQAIVIAGVAKDNRGNLLANVDVDVMDADANFVTNGKTDENGNYRFDLKIDLTSENVVNVEKDYWLFGKSGDFYDSKNPVADLSKPNVFEANFFFRTQPEISLEITIHEENSEVLLSDYVIEFVDQSENEKRLLKTSNDKAVIILDDKKIGDVTTYAF